ncbi:MAG: hypothetical protein RL301_551 [Actinomycetota bacterium]
MHMNSSTNWPAPFRGLKPVSASVTIPGSKSVTNRALILAAQAEGTSKLHRPLVSRDTELMAAGLKSLGVKIDVKNNGNENEIWEITRGKISTDKVKTKIDVGNAGTVMRFLPPLAAFANGEIEFDGDPRSHERPLGPVIKALEGLGISIDHGSKYSLPMKLIATGQVRGGAIEIDASKSSQFLSALLLIAPSTEEGITVKHVGGELPSMPHIDMTVQMLEGFGAKVSVDKLKKIWSVAPGKLKAVDLIIEPDLSNAAPFLSIAMVCGGEITIKDWPKKTTQPGDQLRQIFTAMGAKCEFVSGAEPGLKITGSGKISGINIDLHDVGELTPAIATLCALATSPSHLTGIGHLREHETDRLAAIAKEFNSLGGDVIDEPTALRINPKPLHGGVFHTYEDHRLATSGATLGLVVSGIEVENIDTTRKTLTDFPRLWSSIVG